MCRVYLDHHATTPVDPDVLAAMLPYLTRHFGNPSATDSASGRLAARAVMEARCQVAQLLAAEPLEIIFTAGATEANNLAVLGTIRMLKQVSGRRKIVTTPIEHKAILAAFDVAAAEGFEVVLLPVQRDGHVDVDAARELINDEVLFVSVQTANNEIGSTQPVQMLATLAHDVGAIFHTDAAQAVGKVDVSVLNTGVDLLSLSAHKFYGPKGVGALFVRNGPASFPILPLTYGGGQEQGLRAGTTNVPGVVGLGQAAILALDRLETDALHMATVRDAFEARLLMHLPELQRNGNLAQRLPNNSSMTFRELDARALIAHVPELDLSTGSACTSGAIEPSHVLQAIGLSRSEGHATVRIGFGRGNSLSEGLQAAGLLATGAARLRELR